MSRRPADSPWTHAHLPDEATAYFSGYRADPKQPLPQLLAEDKHAWRGVVDANRGIPGAMGEQWRAFVDAEIWYSSEAFPVRSRLAEERVRFLATPADDLRQPRRYALTPSAKAAGLPPPSQLPPAS